MSDFMVLSADHPLYKFAMEDAQKKESIFDDTLFEWIQIKQAALHHEGLQEAVEQVIILYRLLKDNEQIKPK
jgi:hypothetical protein